MKEQAGFIKRFCQMEQILTAINCYHFKGVI